MDEDDVLAVLEDVSKVVEDCHSRLFGSFRHGVPLTTRQKFDLMERTLADITEYTDYIVRNLQLNKEEAFG